MTEQEPMLMESAITKRVYVVTGYEDNGDGTFTARRKHDVTGQFDTLAERRKAGGRMYRRALARARELESLVRDMGAYIDGIVNECYTINMAHGRDLLARMAELGIDEEGGGA